MRSRHTVTDERSLVEGFDSKYIGAASEGNCGGGNDGDDARLLVGRAFLLGDHDGQEFDELS